jgi:hypothetical protein
VVIEVGGLTKSASETPPTIAGLNSGEFS